MKAKTVIATILMLTLLLSATACSSNSNSSSTTVTPATISDSGTTPTSSGTLSDPASSEETTSDFSITADSTGAYTGSGSVYTITAAGEYTLTGKLEDGQIVVTAGEEDEVTLILNNVSITCSTGCPILVTQAGDVTIKSPDGTYNVITETGEAVITSSTEDDDSSDTTGSAIYADCDLKLSGKGTLIVTSENNKGIKTTKDLEIKNVTLKVTASKVAIKGNDSVTIESGNIIVISENGDGIKTSNTDVSSSGNQRGILTIRGGQVDIYAADDGLSGAYSVVIETGDSEPVLNIFTGAYSGYTEQAQDSMKGIKAAGTISISGGVITIKSPDDGIHANSDEAYENGSTSYGAIEISGGTLTVTAADDGMHADGTLTVSGGSVTVPKSYEGLEANIITISGGNTYVYATDDGLNASSGASTPCIYIKGGTLEVVTPSGDTDAIDANGNVVMSGGFVLVEGGASSGGMAGSVDVDGSITVTGGTILAFGGICETPSNGSVCTYISSGTSFGSGDYVLSDASGNAIASFTLSSTYSGLWVSSDAFVLNGSYTIARNGTTVVSWTQSSNTEGSAGNAGGFGPGGFGPGGGGGMRR